MSIMSENTTSEVVTTLQKLKKNTTKNKTEQ